MPDSKMRPGSHAAGLDHSALQDLRGPSTIVGCTATFWRCDFEVKVRMQFAAGMAAAGMLPNRSLNTSGSRGNPVEMLYRS